MTQYRAEVEEVRRQHQARKWAKGVAYIYAHDGVTEIHYNSGKVTHFKGLRTNIFGMKKSIEVEVEPAMPWEQIVMGFSRAQVDNNSGWSEW